MEIPLALLSLLLGILCGMLEGAKYSLASPRRDFLLGLTKASRILPPWWLVAIERTVIPFFATGIFLLSMLLIWPTNPPPDLNPIWFLLFFPGFSGASSIVVVRRWRSERKQDQE